jgi:hypothetical protein
METLNLRENRPDKIFKITLDGKNFLEITDKLPITNIIEMASLENNPDKVDVKNIDAMIKAIENILLLRNDENKVKDFIKQIDSQDVIRIFQYISEKCNQKIDEKKKE